MVFLRSRGRTLPLPLHVGQEYLLGPPNMPGTFPVPSQFGHSIGMSPVAQNATEVIKVTAKKKAAHPQASRSKLLVISFASVSQVSKYQYPVPNRVLCIRQFSVPAKILNCVVETIAIIMTCFTAIRRRTDKGQQYQSRSVFPAVTSIIQTNRIPLTAVELSAIWLQVLSNAATSANYSPIARGEIPLSPFNSS